MIAGRTLRRRRAAAQLLLEPGAGGAVEAVRRLLAVQAQDHPSARLALRARTARLTAADVDRALTDERSLVVAWLARGTLHLVAAEDHRWLLALTAPARAATNDRRLREEGVTPAQADRALDMIVRALAADGPLPRAVLAERLAAAGIPVAGQALPHLVMRAALRGLVVLGPVRDGERHVALARDWLGAAPAAPLDAAARDRAPAELARRWLAAHGPGTAQDLAAWAGLPAGWARAAMSGAAASLADLGGGLVDLAGRGDPPGDPPPRLLPAFDPYILGWRDRAFAVPDPHARDVQPGGGVLRAVATDGGRVVGTWSLRRRAGVAHVELAPFGPLPAPVTRALTADAVDVARFEGLTAPAPQASP